MHNKTTSDWKSFLPPAWITALLGLSTILWLAYSLRELVFLLVIGYCIAYLIDPLLCWLEARRIRRPVGVFIVAAGAFMVALLILLTIIPRLLMEAGNLISNLPEYLGAAKTSLLNLARTIDNQLPTKWLESGGIEGLIKRVEIANMLNQQVINRFLSGVLQALLKGYSITLTLLNLVLLPFIVYYLAIDLKRAHYSILLSFPKKRRLYVRQIFREIDQTISAFIRGQMIVATILCGMYGAGLAVIGVDFWFAIALLSGLGSMAPYVGGLLGISLATLMGLVTFGTLYHLILIWLVFVVVQFIEGTFITPNVVGQQVGLSPLAVILALFAGASLFGIIGVFFAIPAAATLKVLSKHAATTIFRAPGGGLRLPESDN